MPSENALKTHTGHKYLQGIENMPPFPPRSFRISWDFMSWEFMWFHWISCDVMGFHGISCDFMGFHVVSCDFMGFHGISCDFMGFHGISYDI